MGRLLELLDGIRAGDEAAAAEFFRTYEPHVRRVVRGRLRAGAGATAARRVSDSSDLCQVVLASFMVGSALGRYEINDSEAARKLLARIAMNKVIDLRRRPDVRVPASPVASPGVDGIEPLATCSSPASQVALRELIEKAEALLSQSERQIAQLRKRGLSWNEVGRMLGKSAEAARKTLERAAERIMKTLGLEGPIDV
jgi:RNA polymerase sigma factor (sigma-70 family)